MRTSVSAARLVALLLALILSIPVLSANAAATNATAVPDSVSPVSHFDYFSDVYPNLKDAGHVFKTATYEDIAHIFESAGTYAVLFGGASVPSTQAEIGYIDQAAKAYGISTIYNFDTKLDGVSLDLADSASPFASLYTDLVAKYLTEKDASGNAVATSPAADVKNQTFLFIYNKDHKNDANSQPIVKFIKNGSSAADFQTGGTEDAAKAGAFKAQVKDVFGAAPAADYKTIASNDFIEPAFNKNVKFNSPNVGRDIFDGTDGQLVFEHVTYHELTKLLGSEGNYVILFGGSWCPNTQAAIKFINEYAHKYKVDKVYMWDPRLDAGVDVTKTDLPTFDSHENDRLMVRGTGHPYANLYVDLVNTYLTNIQTQYVKDTTNVTYKDANGKDVVANKLQVPYLYVYNKDNKDAAGKSAPILGHVELMYSWTNIQPDYKSNGVSPNATYKTALDKLFSRLESVPSGLTGVAPTTGNNGQITGANAALEYKAASATDYAPVTGTAITGLAPGTYNVRYAAKPGFNGPISSKADGVTTLIAPAQVPYAAGQSVNVTVPEAAPANASFADVPSSAWYSEAVGYLAANGIASGTDATHYSPSANVTRGQFLVLLLKAYGIEPNETEASNFADAGDTYYTNYLGAAKRLGITTGLGDNLYAPSKAITRQDLFTLLYRALDVLGKLPAGDAGPALSSFADAGQIPGYAGDAFRALVKSGVVTGSDGKLNPAGLSTRAEVAQVLYNLLSNK
ncbi:S-layer homology domain-containing protein [Paenibacillus glycinis]|uniref:SLH domain-containing protein n=1 Tax=Paenibacillus glycinis TaxID=2697035 RepID=A0ABW9XXV0_9BACL|nr:S-layer homology domain-containing protein [Paenibacillus glycinis]NBD27104.1 hypothetical protein [Paenibacillus glycinis]